MKLSTFIKLSYRKIVELRNPVNAAKMCGVNFGKNFRPYGHIRWGSEPWIISIGDDVVLGDGIRFITHDGSTLVFRKEIPDLEITKPITIGNNVFVGIEVMIMPGVNIGNNVVIGARSVVTRDIPDNCVAAGVPAKVIRTIDEYKEKLEAESLHLGHLKGKEKDEALKKYYGYNK